MKRITSMLVCLLLFGFTAIYAQDVQLKGKITSAEDGSALPGVSVVVKGTTTGVASDVNGNFTLTVPSDATIMVSSVGYTTQEIRVAGKTVIDVALESEVLAVDEVIVTALGISRSKNALGYTIQEVKSEEIEKSKNVNVINSLSGKVAGVRVNSSSGMAGASTFVEIRGSASLTRNNRPLMVVDGVPIMSGGGVDDVDGVAMSDAAISLNPNDIESMTVLKGGAATALYGLRAATGAIIITTKKGQAGKIKIDFNSSVTMEKISQMPERQSKYAEGTRGGFVAFGSTSWGPRIDTCRYATDDAAFPANSRYTDGANYMKKWDPNGYIVSQNDPLSTGKQIVTYDPIDFFQTAYTYNNNLGISGGNERSTFYFSIGNTNATGVVPNNSFNKTNFKISADHKLNSKFSMGANFNYTYQKSQRIQQGSNTSGVMLGLLRTPITFDNSYGYMFENGKQRSYRGGTGYDNPYWTANKNSFKGHADRVIGDIHLSYAPLTWMNVTYRLGLDLMSGGYKDYLAKYSNTYPDGSVEVDNSIERDLNSDLLLNFRKTFGDLDASLTLGNNIYESYYQGTNAQALNLVITDWDNMANTTDNRGYEASNTKRTLAFFGELALGYKSMLFFDATLRNEQSTTLPEANNSFYYPSVSLGFIFTELGGLKDNSILSFGKLRASYAVTAQDAALYATDNYYYVGAFLDGWTSGIQFPFLGVSGYTYTDQLGNLDLKPEKMKTFEIGGEFRFLNNRLHLDVAYFQNTNTDLLLAVPIAFSTGFGNKYMNAASMTTTGIELELDADIVKSKSFTWNLAVNWSNPKTMVDELAPGVDNLLLGGFTGSQIRAVAGQEYRSVYATTWAKDANGNILINPTGSFAGYPVASNNMEYIADVSEDWRMGIINTFNLKGISLLALLEIKQGGYMWNGTRGALDYFGTSKGTEDREPTDLSVYQGVYGYLDPISGDPIYLDAAGNESATAVANDQQVRKNKQSWRAGNGSGFQGPSEDYVEPSGWIRLREVTLSYDLPSSLLQKSFIRQLGVFVTGRNLWLSTDYSGIDPETNLLGASNAQGIDYFNMPGTKSYTFGLKVTF